MEDEEETTGVPTQGELTEKEAAALSEDLDKEYFAWKESDQEEEKKPEEGKRYFLSLRQKIKIEEETHEVI